MKKLLSQVFFLLLIGSALLPSQELDNSQRTKRLLEKISTSLTHGYDDAVSVIEGGSSALKKNPEFVELQNQANSTWLETLNDIQGIAPTDTSKAILLEVFESSLSVDNYLQFLNQTIGLAQNKIVDRRFLSWALLPSDKNVREVLGRNYDKSEVREILAKAKLFYVDDPNMVRYCDTILSGEAKKGSEAYFHENPADAWPKQASSDSTSDLAASVASASKLTSPSSRAATPYFKMKTYWIYGVVVVGLGAIVGLWRFLRSKS